MYVCRHFVVSALFMAQQLRGDAELVWATSELKTLIKIRCRRISRGKG